MKVRKLSALVALGLAAGLVVPATAQSQPNATTYTIHAGLDLQGVGVPGFSARFFPGSVKVHSGDKLHFEFATLMAAGAYPQEWAGENYANIGDAWNFLKWDPDDGPRAVKVDESMFEPNSDCGAVDNPCQWTGSETEPTVPAGSEQGTFVEVTAPPGTTMWATTIFSPEINTNLKVEVVAPSEAASTQEELDARAAALAQKDLEDAAAIDNKLRAKRTFHLNEAGKRVYDIWVGGIGGPIELFASYPKKIRVPVGARVQYHFQSEIEPHTATFGGAKAREMFETGIFPFCDPDGDEGTAADTFPEFGDQGPVCPEGSTMEIDVSNRWLYETGDRRHTRKLDYENSGLKVPTFPESVTLDSDPWTVRMMQKSNDRGFKYICLLHGGFMGGRVVVK